MRKIILLLLLLSCLCYGQNSFIRIYKTDNSFIDCKKVSEQKDRTNYETIDGEASYIENSKINYIGNIDTNIERFEYKDKILEDTKVFNVNNVEAKEIFRRSRNWIIENYKNPDEVIKGTIENEMIRFNGARINCISVSSLGFTHNYSLNYTISLYFKHGKYKFETTDIYYRIPPSRDNLNGFDMPLKYFGSYNKKGEIRSMFKKVPFQVEEVINEISLSLYKYIVDNNIKKNDW